MRGVQIVCTFRKTNFHISFTKRTVWFKQFYKWVMTLRPRMGVRSKQVRQAALRLSLEQILVEKIPRSELGASVKHHVSGRHRLFHHDTILY